MKWGLILVLLVLASLRAVPNVSADAVGYEVSSENIEDQRIDLSVTYSQNRSEYSFRIVVTGSTEELQPYRWTGSLALPETIRASMPGVREDSTVTWSFAVHRGALAETRFSIRKGEPPQDHTFGPGLTIWNVRLASFVEEEWALEPRRKSLAALVFGVCAVLSLGTAGGLFALNRRRRAAMRRVLS